MPRSMGQRMFGTNGVRGVANRDMSCELALGMGRSVAVVLGKRIAVARDPRTSSVMLRDALCAGLVSMGAEVFDLGMIPTPALQHWIKSRDDMDGGVMITASHNPPEFNGIKCIAGDGTECTEEQEDAIESAYHEGASGLPWDDIGTVTGVDRAAEEYISSIVAGVDTDAIRDAGLRVILDCANGCACATSPELLRRLGTDVTVINEMGAMPTRNYRIGRFEGADGLSGERMQALRLLLEKYSPDDCVTGMRYAEKSFHRTEILRLEVETVSGKAKRIG